MYQTRSSTANRRPPLVHSPNRPRAPKMICTSASLQTPLSRQEKSGLTRPSWALNDSRVRSDLRPMLGEISLARTPLSYLEKSRQLPKPSFDEYLKPMLGELQALAKMVEDEFGNTNVTTSLFNAISTPQFERGRLYEEYSTRRNERLKRKKREREAGEDSAHSSVKDDSCFLVEFGTRKNVRKIASVRKSVPANFSICQREGLRSSVRLRKENMKPPVVPANVGSSFTDGERKRIATRSSLRY